MGVAHHAATTVPPAARPGVRRARVHSGLAVLCRRCRRRLRRARQHVAHGAAGPFDPRHRAVRHLLGVGRVLPPGHGLQPHCAARRRGDGPHQPRAHAKPKVHHAALARGPADPLVDRAVHGEHGGPPLLPHAPPLVGSAQGRARAAAGDVSPLRHAAQSKWPSRRRHGRPPRVRQTASEGSGLPSALLRRAPMRRMPPSGRDLGATSHQNSPILAAPRPDPLPNARAHRRPTRASTICSRTRRRRRTRSPTRSTGWRGARRAAARAAATACRC